MSRIVVGSYLIRYPLGGMMSWVLQYLSGLHQLGHEVWFVERATWPDACFDPARNRMSDDPSAGIAVARPLLDRVGVGDRWCFVDHAGRSHGVPLHRMRRVLAGADAYIDMGVHGAWNDEAVDAGCMVLIDGEPGFTQLKMVQREGTPAALPPYDHYFSSGQLVGTPDTLVPDAGHVWRPILHPVDLDLFPPSTPRCNAPVTTVMNWQSYDAVEHDGVVYGHKDVEFEAFVDLPRRVPAARLEVAVSGTDVPRERLAAAGWSVRNGIDVTRTFTDFRGYIRASSAEFSVCKSGYVRLRTGWFSDRSAAYLASGRPVVLQDTGFSACLPTGEGLFAVRDANDAACALDAIAADPARHRRAARDLAADLFDARIVLRRFLEEIGL